MHELFFKWCKKYGGLAYFLQFLLLHLFERKWRFWIPPQLLKLMFNVSGLIEQPGKKRGRPKLFLPKEVVEERRVVKWLSTNYRRALQGTSCLKKLLWHCASYFCVLNSVSLNVVTWCALSRLSGSGHVRS